MNFRNKIFYLLKPVIPRRIQIFLRRKQIARLRLKSSSIWPILHKSQKAPDGWKGWPNRKEFAVILTHDVEAHEGQNKCRPLAELEKSLGFRSSFNFVPERYRVDADLRMQLTLRGFEVGVHGLKHDGKLFKSKKIFNRRSKKINEYLKEWNAVGFRSPAMHHNLDWINELNVKYDSSTFDTDPFEPQSDGVETIFPFWVYSSGVTSKGYVELPYTLPQDFTLFILMEEKTIDIWKRKLEWIANSGGMALLNTHPDYMAFNSGAPGIEEYTVDYYREFLEFIKIKYEGKYWHALPREMAAFWSK